uniref:Uncharacterized protein n=1 Tax=Onchocerca volvulus TaxID=6282 RepID=A0A8R1XUN8_ONCVO
MEKAKAHITNNMYTQLKGCCFVVLYIILFLPTFPKIRAATNNFSFCSWRFDITFNRSQKLRNDEEVIRRLDCSSTDGNYKCSAGARITVKIGAGIVSFVRSKIHRNYCFWRDDLN